MNPRKPCTGHVTIVRTEKRPTRPDGTLDVAAWCAQLDAEANRGAATGPGHVERNR